MAQAQTTYVRLPGTGYRRTVPGWLMFLLFFVLGLFVLLLRGPRMQLWLGPDHLLLVEWNGSRERYRRLYYRDIQWIVLRRTAEWWLVSLLLGMTVGGLILIAALVQEAAATAVFSVLAGVLLLILVIHFVMGPSCACQLRTAVQTVDLDSLNRLRHSRPALQLLQARIHTAQGAVTREELETWQQAF